MIFRHPHIFWLFLIYIPLIYWYITRYRHSSPSIGVSTVASLAKLSGGWKTIAMHFCFFLELVAIGGAITALARPQVSDHLSNSRVEGTDIILALDISGSMSANDFSPNRFEVAKDVAAKFINNRPDDNMGLVIFSGESLSLMPLTNDRAALVNAISNIRMGSLEDGTALGDGLTSAVNRISSGHARSKSIILLTDGSNNAGDVPPSTAAQIAKQKGIRVYTIGIGTNGSIQIADPYGFSSTTIETKIDEITLRNIANTTGGKFFRATNRRMLQEVFDEIDSLEKTVLDVDRYSRTDEYFMPFVLLSVISFGLMLLMRYLILRRIP